MKFSLLIVCLSLLTITNLIQIHEVLLLVFSKMADETNLSSKLPVADRTREIWGRKLYWWCLISRFPLSTFLLEFADSFCFVFTSTPSYEALPLRSILYNLFPRLCWYAEVFKGDFEGVLVSLLITMGAFSHFSPQKIFFGKCSSGTLVTWPVHLNCANFRRVWIVHSASLPFSGLLCLESCLAT